MHIKNGYFLINTNWFSIYKFRRAPNPQWREVEIMFGMIWSVRLYLTWQRRWVTTFDCLMPNITNKKKKRNNNNHWIIDKQNRTLRYLYRKLWKCATDTMIKYLSNKMSKCLLRIFIDILHDFKLVNIIKTWKYISFNHSLTTQ